MSPTAGTICLAAAAYLLGSVPFSLLLGLSRGVDIRRIGSGNVGATNLGRALGRRWAIVAFLLDFSKGFLPVLAARLLAADGCGLPSHGSEGGAVLAGTEGGWAPVLIGLAAILGHVFPLTLRFRGGKGVATTFGVMAALSWLSTSLAALVWGTVFAATRTVSVASLAAAASLPPGTWLFERGRADGAFPAIGAFSATVALLVFVRHADNLRRLVRGEELECRRGDRAGGHADDRGVNRGDERRDEEGEAERVER